MRIAVACDGLVVAPYFVQSRSYMIYFVELGRIVGSRNLPIFDKPIFKLVDFLKSLEIDVLIVGRIENDIAAMLRSSGVELVTYAKDDPLVAVQEYLASVFSAVED